MTKTRLAILTAVNIIVILIGCALFIFALRKTPSSSDSRERIVAKINAVSDVEKLHSMLYRDDEYIRSLENIIAVYPNLLKGVLILFGIFAVLNVVLLHSPQSTKQKKIQGIPPNSET